jgi:hypothetical protein
MAKEIVEILSPFNSYEPVQRMKIGALTTHLGHDLDFRPFGNSDVGPACVLINNFQSNTSLFDGANLFHPAFKQLLQLKRKSAVVMLFVSDIIGSVMPFFRTWSSVVDVFLVGTPETRNFLRAYTEREVEVLFDPIDFCLNDSVKKSENAATDKPLKVVWFGFPTSYDSLLEYNATLTRLHQAGDIEYNIVTKHPFYGRAPFGIVHEYIVESFPTLLQTFDVCVLSHSPADFWISTLWKTENKAVLAINRGVAVTASRTPAYQRLLARCGLEEFLFSSNTELEASLRRLQSWPERHRFLTRSQERVLEEYSSRKMAADWLRIYRDARERKLRLA